MSGYVSQTPNGIETWSHNDIAQGPSRPLYLLQPVEWAKKKYHSRLGELIAMKKGELYSKTISWIRATETINMNPNLIKRFCQ